ncbi:hypothetical protein SCUCBS95973_005562 [Sporothrix curviconia]|uniref:Caib baif family enzyme n=1 Tax=Sporothrix curviconia TaxID=1260050 RepID=A0ABP0BXV6_9PEZI
MGSVPQPSPTAEVLCQIVTPVGMLGYGFVYRGLELAHLNHPAVPTAIVLDSGSTDSGPSKLALGSTTCPESAYRRDLLGILRAARQYGVPMLLSSAGGDGEDEHVRLFGRIVQDVADELNKEGEEGQGNSTGARLKVVSVFSTLDKSLVLERLQAGAITGCGPCVPALTPEAQAETTVVVGQMGPEPFVDALAAHPDADVVLGGRAYDPSPYVAYCVHNFFKSTAQTTTPVVDIPAQILGGFTHMGKIMECGGLCATPKSRGSMVTVYRDGTFAIRPLAPGAVCQPLTVAAHTLYEKARPDHLAGPGGILDVTTATYARLDDGLSAHVAGATFIPSTHASPQSPPQQVKGFAAQQHPALARDQWELDFHIYDGKDHDGEDAGMAPPPPTAGGLPGVVFIVGEALARTQADANSLASAARIACVHAPYPGQKANSGNFGMGIGGRGERGEEGAVEVTASGSGSGSENTGNTSDSEDQKKGLLRFEAVWAGARDGQRITELPFRFDAEKAALVNTKAVKKANANGTTSSPALSTTATATATATTTTSSPTLGSLAKILRSKNSGPFEITLDVLFDDRAVYEQVKASNTLIPARVAALYGLQPDQLVYCGFFDQALAFKATLPRMRNGKPMASGGFMENDVHGSQKYKPLMNLVVELSGRRVWS